MTVVPGWTSSRVVGRLALRTAAGVSLAYILLPMFFVIWLAFFAQEIPSFPPEGYSLKWFRAIPGNDRFVKGVAVAIAANISSKENLQNLVNESNRAFGKIDVLVCNAASNPYYGPLGGISDDQFRKILDNNIVANNWLISMVVPQMIERKDGSIVIVSSIGGLKGSTVLGAYAISKAADMQLARNLACEYGKHNIRVNCIAPGLIKTDFAKALWDNPETLKASTARSPLLRIGIPDEIAGAAVFMGSAAGDFMTGQTIVIDGGATIS